MHCPQKPHFYLHMILKWCSKPGCNRKTPVIYLHFNHILGQWYQEFQIFFSYNFVTSLFLKKKVWVHLFCVSSFALETSNRNPQSCKGIILDFPDNPSGKERACQCRKCERFGFDPWVGKISWRKAWRPTPVFLPGESHGQMSLAG